MVKILNNIIYVLFSKVFFRVTHINKINEEKLDRCIICANHSTFVDPLYLLPKINNLKIMAKAELFKYKWFANILNKMGVFPIHRGSQDAKSLIHSINLFEHKNKLLVFPEGTRNKTNKKIYKVGPVFIASKANVPIIPVYITQNPKLFSKVKIIYGEPIYISHERSKDKKYLEEKSKELMELIYSFKEEKNV